MWIIFTLQQKGMEFKVKNVFILNWMSFMTSAYLLLSVIYWHGVFSMHFGTLQLDLTNFLFLIFALYSFELKIALMLFQNKCQNSKKSLKPTFLMKIKSKSIKFRLIS